MRTTSCYSVKLRPVIVSVFRGFWQIAHPYLGKNPAKSKAYFILQVSRIAQRRLLRIMGIPCGTIPFTYLGVPLFIGKPRRAYFQPVADRILGKLAKWKGSIDGWTYLLDRLVPTPLFIQC